MPIRLILPTDRRERQLVLAMIMLFVLILFAGLTIKLNNWAQGYDQIDYQQSIWNTTQGRFLEITHYRHTDSLWGMDFIPAILVIVPFYALFPSALTLNFFQAFCMALGAWPVYLIARERFRTPWAGVLCAAVYLLYPSTGYATMSAPWQPRTLAVPALLGAFVFLQRVVLAHAERTKPPARTWLWFGLCLLLALTTRTDASLCVIAFGLLAGLWRLGWRWALPPIVIGLAWFLLSTSVIVPSFYRADYQPKEIRSGPDACADYATNWPGKSPQLAYYCHLGGSAGEIVLNVLTKPLQTVQIMFTQPKLTYLFLMLLPLLFLPLLAPDAALPALPILAMNLLTNRTFQYTVREQYQTLVIPGLIIATIVGAARLWAWYDRQQNNEQPTKNRNTAQQSAPWYAAYRQPHAASHMLLLLLAATLITNLWYRNPVLAAVRFRDTPVRLAAMRELAAMMPADAPVAATSFLAPNLMPRRQIYYFPNSPAFPPLENAEYLFIDLRASGLDMPNGRQAMQAMRESGRWHTIASREDLVLLQRVR